ncbi:MAG: 50S ribosomal protein L11 methyltransferase [Oscillospiraceae bacterium]|nr:50S ribosomal protein L11 methyltransferase [Oscillospiraceae bacterium]
MEWIKLKIETVPEGISAISDILEECGIFTFEIEDSSEFLDEFEKIKGRWDFVDEALYEEKSKACSVSAYVANTKAGKATLDAIKSKIASQKSDSDWVSLEMFVSVMDEEDWANSWKKYFVPLPVGKNILVCPVWEDVPEEHKSRTVFKIDPGMSFGTGTHETTRLCLEALERRIWRGDTVLDLGCGSGILSIVALLLGARLAVAADIDENCPKIARANAELNGVLPGDYELFSGDVLQSAELQKKLSANKYDIVLANIVPDVIIPLLPFIKSVLSEGGVAILSGIIGRYLTDVKSAACSLGFEILAVTQENDWHCIEVGV